MRPLTDHNAAVLIHDAGFLVVDINDEGADGTESGGAGGMGDVGSCAAFVRTLREQLAKALEFLVIGLVEDGTRSLGQIGIGGFIGISADALLQQIRISVLRAVDGIKLGKWTRRRMHEHL